MTEFGHRWVPAPERRHLPRDVSQLCLSHGGSDVSTNRALRTDQCCGVDVPLRELAPALLQDLSNR